MGQLGIDGARRIFGGSMIGPEQVAQLLGEPCDAAGPLALDASTAEQAAASGCACIWRPARTASGKPVTMALLHERTAAARGRGFRGDEPWWLEQPSALEETPEAGWAIFHRVPIGSTLNRTFDAGSAELERFAGGRPWRRRRAVEIALDTLVAALAGQRLLESTWDWSASPSTDGGLLNLGGFGPEGLEVLAYSRAVKHGALGICPTLVLAGR